MAHKTKANGTTYEISGGKTKINGTGYDISTGKTKIGGTGHDIAFGGTVTVTFKALDDPDSILASAWITIGDVEYAIREQGTAVTLELETGSSIFIRKHGDGYGGEGEVYVNGIEVKDNSNTSRYDYIYTIPSGVRSVDISSEGGGFIIGQVYIVES